MPESGIRSGRPRIKAPMAYETMMIGTRVRKGLLMNVPRVDGDFVEAKKKGHRRGHDRVQTEERRERDEYADRKSKRRSLRWIIQREQTAKGGAKHT